ncbi:MAG: hypothetical protein Q9182_005926 [Xanthomendoza sp. 2 TL-2023]
MPSVTEIGASPELLNIESDQQYALEISDLDSLPQDSRLPTELLLQIVTYVLGFSSAQRDLWAMTLVSRSWYAAAVTTLYRKPDISGKNFNLFVRTLCPSINAHIRKSSFSTMIEELDMSRLVHDSSRSLTSRILGRLKDGLEGFVAPQSSFGYVCLPPRHLATLHSILKAVSINCLAALSKCQHLRKLDLSYVSESLALSQLLHSVSKLPQLEELLIRCMVDHNYVAEPPNVRWPPRLKTLQFSGPIQDCQVAIFSTLPKSTTALTVHHCPNLTIQAFRRLLVNFGAALEFFQFGPRTSNVVKGTNLIHCLECAPKLRRLVMPATTYSIWTRGYPDVPVRYDALNPHPLEHLTFDCTALDRQGMQLDYEDIWSAIADGYLGHVRRLGFCHQANVQPWRTGRRALQDLDELLRALAREDGPSASVKEEDAGVYVYNS